MIYKKSDRRNLQSDTFRHYIEMERSDLKGAITSLSQWYFVVRTWCQDSLGPAIPIHYFEVGQRLQGSYPTMMSGRWTYDDDKHRIYLRGEVELNLFQLRWKA